jgi:hypothetical protein
VVLETQVIDGRSGPPRIDVSLLGRKRNGISEFSYYSFRDDSTNRKTGAVTAMLFAMRGEAQRMIHLGVCIVLSAGYAIADGLLLTYGTASNRQCIRAKG